MKCVDEIFPRSKVNGESRVKALSAALSSSQNGHFPSRQRPTSAKPPQFYFGQNLNSLVKMSPFLEGDRGKASRGPRFGTGGRGKIPNGRFQRPPDDEDDNGFQADESEVPKLNGSFGSVFMKIRNGGNSNGGVGGSRFYDDDVLLRKPKQADAETSFLARIGRSAEMTNLPCYKYLAPKLSSCLSSAKTERTQDDVIKEFEAELAEGKLRLRKVFPDSDPTSGGRRRQRPLSSGTIEGSSSEFFFELDAPEIPDRPISPDSEPPSSPASASSPSPPPLPPPPPPPPPPCPGRWGVGRR